MRNYRLQSIKALDITKASPEEVLRVLNSTGYAGTFEIDGGIRRGWTAFGRTLNYTEEVIKTGDVIVSEVHEL